MVTSFARLRGLFTGLLCFGAIAALGASSPEERVIVTGRGRLVEIQYSSDLTVSKILIRAGGLSDFGQTPVFLIRSGRATRIKMNALLRGDRGEDPQLRPWDIIAIGTTLTHRK